MNRLLIILVAYFLLSVATAAQGEVPDSLRKALAAALHDTDRIKLLNALSWDHYQLGDYTLVLRYATRSRDLCLKIDPPTTFSKKALGKVYTNLGNVQYDFGNYPEALRHHLLSLRLREEIADSVGIAICYNNIGNVYFNQESYADALKYYRLSVELKQRIGDKRGVISTYGNIGVVHQMNNQLDSSLRYHLLTLRLAKELADTGALATAYSNLGVTWYELDLYGKALEDYQRGLALRMRVGDKKGVADSYHKIGATYAVMHRPKVAMQWLRGALDLAHELKDVDKLSETYLSLALADSALAREAARKGQASLAGRYSRDALGHYKLHIAYRDSLLNEENTRQTVQQQMQYEFDKKEAAARLEQEKRDAVALAESRRQKMVLAAVTIFGLLVLGFAIFAYRSFLQKKRANDEISCQKRLIEEKQKEILDSIHYARRIQNSLLPSERHIAKLLKTSAKWRYMVIIIFFSHLVCGQNLDSLNRVASAGPTVTARVNALNELAWICSSSGPDSALRLSARAFSLIAASDLDFYQGKGWHMGQSVNQVAVFLFMKGEFGRALEHYKKALGVWEALEKEPGFHSAQDILGRKASTFCNMGIIFKEKGEYPEALRLFFSALRFTEKTGNKGQMASCLGNIGVIYMQTRDTAAITYFTRALRLSEELQDAYNTSMWCGNLGNMYVDMARANDRSTYRYADIATSFYSKALKLAEQSNDLNTAAWLYSSIGLAYHRKRDEAKSLAFYDTALNICRQLGDKAGIAAHLGSIGELYNDKGDLRMAFYYLKQAQEMSVSIGALDLVHDHYSRLSSLASKMGDHKQAFGFYKLSVLYHDSVYNDLNTKKTVETQMQYEFDKKEEAAKLLQERRDALTQADRQKQNLILFSVSGLGLLVLAFAIFAWRSFLQKKKANIRISRQKHLIEEKQKEILDSIYYARRIQASLMPNEKHIARTLQRLSGNRESASPA